MEKSDLCKIKCDVYSVTRYAPGLDPAMKFLVQM